MKRFEVFLICLIGLIGLEFSCFAQGPDFEELAKSARSSLQFMVEADTSNPPGSERRIVEFVANRLKETGIEYEISEFAPGRENIVASRILSLSR